MSFKRVSAFNFVPTISEDPDCDTGSPSLRRLREIVAGKDETYPRSQSMAMLLRTDFPNKHRDFEAVLENEREPPELRYLAAIHLGTMATPAALEILVRNSRVRDERVLAGVMKALGRIGDRSALDAITAARQYATGAAARQAEFAATLIAHRTGSEEYAPPVAVTASLLELDLHCARPFRVTRADGADAELCLRSLAGQPFGIEFAEHPMYQVRCGRKTSMILLNREFTTEASVESLQRRRAFLGVVAARSEDTRLYSVAQLMLTAPAEGKDEIRLFIHRPNGDLAFAGTAQVAENCAGFSIRAVPRPGAFAVSIEGRFEDGKLDITTALSTRFVQIAKREPIEDRGAEGEP